MKSNHHPEIDLGHDPMAKRETTEFIRAYRRIADPAVRKRLFELTKAVPKLRALNKLSRGLPYRSKIRRK